jgi:hypothetical protein
VLPISASRLAVGRTGIVRSAMALSQDVNAQAWRVTTLATASATGAALAFAPIISTSSCSTTSTGVSTCTSSQESLIANEGGSVLLVLAIPALVALIAVVARTPRATVVTAGLLTAAALVSLASIGIFLIPAVVVAWTAVSASRLTGTQEPHRSPAP